jgi:hypothetical protein
MSQFTKSLLGAILLVAGIPIVVGSIMVVLTHYSYNYDFIILPLMILGISQGLLVSGVGLIVCCLSSDNKADESDEEKTEEENN